MGFQPGQLFRRKKCVGSGSDEVLFSHFLIVVAIFLLDPVHPCFQLRKQIRAVFINRKIEIGRTDFADRQRMPRFHKIFGCEGIHSDIGIQLTVFQLLKGFFL